ncbi:energy-coupling factor transporter transmembrane protein EcfT [Gordonia sp. CPCC 205515]|uniref:energy-coupling factor transporter transmembrane component T family protein n=1 Tax=Gordonia sp. CPCC 205515 TaxID=3140791 RepID=UPI003AF3E601
MTTLGVYRPGSSPLHRLPAGLKLGALAVAILVIGLFVRTPLTLAATIVGVVAVYAIARIRPREAWQQLRPMLWVLAFIATFQVIFTDWRRALVVCGVLAASVALAAVVSLTTRTTDMLDALVGAMKPLQRRGIRVDRIALTLALAIRSIPLMVEVVGQVDEARKARGLRPGARILVAPVVIEALRMADGFADTMIARGLD